MHLTSDICHFLRIVNYVSVIKVMAAVGVMIELAEIQLCFCFLFSFSRLEAPEDSILLAPKTPSIRNCKKKEKG